MYRFDFVGEGLQLVVVVSWRGCKIEGKFQHLVVLVGCLIV